MVQRKSKISTLFEFVTQTNKRFQCFLPVPTDQVTVWSLKNIWSPEKRDWRTRNRITHRGTMGRTSRAWSHCWSHCWLGLIRRIWGEKEDIYFWESCWIFSDVTSRCLSALIGRNPPSLVSPSLTPSAPPLRLTNSYFIKNMKENVSLSSVCDVTAHFDQSGARAAAKKVSAFSSSVFFIIFSCRFVR